MEESDEVKRSTYGLCVFILYILCGCYYPKVNLTKTERKLIAYDKQKGPIVFCSDAGVCDTMHFEYASSRNGYTPNFDHWWDLHVSHIISKGSPRLFHYSVIGTSNFPQDKYSDKNLNLIYILMFLVKTKNEGDLTLGLDGFRESFVIDERTKNDTLVFADKTSEVTCPSGRCLRKAYWTAENGLIRLEKYDGSIWRRKY